jgi:hypothetical protein
MTPRERLRKILRHEKVDRLPISTVGLSPFTWHQDFPDYHPVLEAASRHGEFFAVYRPDMGINYADKACLDLQSTTERESSGRVTTRLELQTPLGPLDAVTIRDPEVGGSAYAKFFVGNEEDLAKRESLPFSPCAASVDGLSEFDKRVGDAGLPYINGIYDALQSAVWGMSDEFRTVFCFTEPERLRKMVNRQHERVMDYVTRLLDAGAGPVFRLYAIEEFTEPLLPPSVVKEFIVPYDRELVQLIHSRGCQVIMHCHGRLDAQIGHMLDIGIDGVDCVECPPQNDIDLRTMLAVSEGRMFFWGYIQFEDLARRTGDEIERLVREAIEQGGTDGRYILSQAASPWSGHIDRRTSDNWIRMIEAGAKYGGH